MKMALLHYITFITVFLATASYCERLEDQIYVKLVGVKQHCFRILNGTGQVGCQSAEDGNIGVVVYGSSLVKVKLMISLFDTSLDLVIAVDTDSLSDEMVQQLLDERVVGVFLLDDGRTIYPNGSISLSEDSSCPNEQFGLYQNTVCEKGFNRDGSIIPEGFRFIDWQKPVFLITNNTEVDIIKNRCYEVFNANGSVNKLPLCSAKLSAFMNGAGDANICLRREKYSVFLADTPNLCDELGSSNLIAFLPPPVRQGGEIRNQLKLLVVAARMDSFSMFSESSVGDVSVLTSLISIIAVAKALGNNLSEFESAANTSRRSVMFSFFHGESLGYIGSSRTVYDMLNGEFPEKPSQRSQQPAILTFNVSDIDAFIEVQQLDGVGSSLTAHVDGKSYFNGTKKMVDNLISSAGSRLNTSWSLSVPSGVTAESELPSSSFQTFLKTKRDIPGFVIAPFRDAYLYKRVNSFADKNYFKREKNVKAVKEQIIASANAILGAVLKYVYDVKEVEADYKIDKFFVTKLFDCFILSKNWFSCDLFSRIIENDKHKYSSGAKNTYISVDTASSDTAPVITLLINALMVHSFGAKDSTNVSSESQCNDLNKHQQVYQYRWQYDYASNSSICYRTAVYITPAISPAFEEPDYDFKSGKYSTWVESQWTTVEVTLFLTSYQYPSHDLCVFLIGCIILVLSLIFMEIVYHSAKDYIEPPAPSFDTDINAAPL